MTMDLNDPELEFSDLVYAYQSWVMAVINDEKLEGDDLLLTDEIAEDALNAMRFLQGPAHGADSREGSVSLLESVFGEEQFR